jgi:ABC-type transporter Mla subunit MlaD
MRRFGRQCRGQGKIFVKLVRQTETQLLERCSSIAALVQEAHQALQTASHLSAATRERLARDLSAAQEAHQQISTQSRRLTQGKKLPHCKIVNAYDPTIAPIMKGKSNCPAQFGRKPGLLSEPTAGFIFATAVPVGNPSDASYVLPLIDKVQHAIARVSGPKTPSIHSVAGDLGVNEHPRKTGQQVVDRVL